MTAVKRIWSDADRMEVQRWAANAPLGTVFTAKRRTRSLASNARMWAMLTAVSEQLEWHGRKWSADDWKDAFCHALTVDRYMPGVDGKPIPLAMRTSEMSQDEHSDLMALIEAFAAKHEVELSNPTQDETDERSAA